MDQGVYASRDKKWTWKYTKKLEANPTNKFQLMIWPEHGLKGDPEKGYGWEIVPIIQQALDKWSFVQTKLRNRKIEVEKIEKGLDVHTEMYSAIRAEVPYTEVDPITKQRTTHTNYDLLTKLKHADKLLVCGQALSHCVNYTMRDMVNEHCDPSKIYLLVDGEEFSIFSIFFLDFSYYNSRCIQPRTPFV